MATPVYPRTMLNTGLKSPQGLINRGMQMGMQAGSLAQAASGINFPHDLAQMAHEQRMRQKYGYGESEEEPMEDASGLLDNRYKKKNRKPLPGALGRAE